ncbi:hypothetical protein IAQ61_010109 [Plenodomus lingam]|uniref:Predicted protein n=1 Tax=Leptosphaeria maculans (strain JN3 / isolate v23.1.3 / race Av1-4-5-6-7-8) TaxID=985895 RepID=E5A2Z0_LEPMJ|nr:predicted protein [Plenodomus lingam JN3]KAH9861908.1 hypothetical protein IAQ61_010109 [Plenodomus lingam]CBX98003.1 predicted protein [Plenodomus lingam JN3]
MDSAGHTSLPDFTSMSRTTIGLDPTSSQSHKANAGGASAQPNFPDRQARQARVSQQAGVRLPYPGTS